MQKDGNDFSKTIFELSLKELILSSILLVFGINGWGVMSSSGSKLTPVDLDKTIKTVVVSRLFLSKFE